MNQTVVKKGNDFFIVSVEYEKCVLCSKETDTVRNSDVTHRRFYVEGAGQLCKECFELTYDKNNICDTLKHPITK